ncbi:MAG TPA: [Fe-Fe] hydrogenase large subunit C-terminal domain-containing protein [Gemmatimonadaceae bacterium]|nr:[Fe-Fe] hydrogenase large subunit C-terminal domain-containing protein [Gemmatimonadaceae bacterium]
MPLGSTPDSRPSLVVVLGADAVLAALPATPVQLAHACRALGYDVAFPASWGDEVVAGTCLDRLHEFGDGPAILCSCPLVMERLTRSGEELAPFMMNLVSPPVAAARYLRALYGERPVRITYAGSCPSASDPSIDARISPAELLLAFEERGIVPAAQPEYFESVLPPDRRRYESIPGGAPYPERLDEVDAGRTLTELSCEDDEIALEIAQRLVAHEHELIDLAPRVGCVCSGALAVGTPSAARARLTALEPPRAHAPVLDPSIHVDAVLPSHAEPAGSPRYGATSSRHATSRSGADLVGARAQAPARHDTSSSEPAAPGASPTTPVRRRRTATIRRSAGQGPAIARDDGAIVPRAFAARMRRVGHAKPSATRSDPGNRPSTGTTADGARRSRRVTRPVVIPLSSEVPRVLPPPPARPRPGNDDPEIGAVAGDL